MSSIDSSIQGVFFDLDGTLVDALQCWERANIQAFAESGYTLTHEIFIEYIRHNHSREWLYEVCGMPADQGGKIDARRNVLSN